MKNIFSIYVTHRQPGEGNLRSEILLINDCEREERKKRVGENWRELEKQKEKSRKRE
jgi:hypothetical protein